MLIDQGARGDVAQSGAEGASLSVDFACNSTTQVENDSYTVLPQYALFLSLNVVLIAFDELFMLTPC